MDNLEAAMNLDSVAFYSREDLAEVLRRLREQAPVYRFESEDLSFWALSKWDDIRLVSTNPGLFSNARGITLIDFRAMEKFGSEVTAGGNEPNMLLVDPPRHRKLRNLIGKVFTPRMVSGLEPRIRAIVRSELEQVPAGEPFDFVEALAEPVPMFVIAEMLGVPSADRALFREFTSSLAAAQLVDEMSDVEIAQFMAAQQDMYTYFDKKLTEREESPTDDLMSGLLSAEVDGERLSRAGQISMCVLLLAAGNETTRNLLSGTIVALVDHSDQRATLVDDLGLLDTAVDEFLRWITPVKTFGRVATADTEIRGQAIKADDRILMLYQSANRDEDAWERPEVFDVRRQVRPEHLAFGWGEHRCLGASLARLEVKVFFQEFLARFPMFELAGEPVRVPSSTLNIIEHLPIVVHAADSNSRR